MLTNLMDRLKMIEWFTVLAAILILVSLVHLAFGATALAVYYLILAIAALIWGRLSEIRGS